MKRISRPRKTATLSESIHRQLNMYALAAGAAGVGMLSFVQPAQARVVYTPADTWLPLNHVFYLDLNHDRVNDFRFNLVSTSHGGTYARGLEMGEAKSSQLRNRVYSALSQSYVCAAALPEGIKVGPDGPFKWGVGIMFQKGYQSSEHLSVCPWLRVKKQAYLGLRFVIKGKIHYGWARFGHISANHLPKAQLTGYAYETIPNKPIRTGETMGTDVVGTTEPASLGHLAAGAAAIPTWRNAGDSQ